MIRKEKTITWELTLDMPEEYALEPVADRIRKLIEHNKDILPDVYLTGLILVKEKHNGEVIR